MCEETDREEPNKDYSKNKLTWYLNPNCPSSNSILPPIHSVTLNPSSFNSPVNSKLTPPNREPHAVWILKLDVSSVMILLKCLVLSPVDDVCVLFDKRHEVVSDEKKRGWARRTREKDARKRAQESSRLPQVPRLLLKRQTALQFKVIDHPVDPQKNV